MSEHEIRSLIKRDYPSRKDDYEYALRKIEEKVLEKNGLTGFSRLSSEILSVLKCFKPCNRKLWDIYYLCLPALSSLSINTFAQELIDIIEAAGIVYCPYCFKEIFSFDKVEDYLSFTFHKKCLVELKGMSRDYLSFLAKQHAAKADSEVKTT